MPQEPELMPDTLVTVVTLAKILGIQPSSVHSYATGRRAIDVPMPEPIPGLYLYCWYWRELEPWVAAYRAAPKLGRRGSGVILAERKLRRIEGRKPGRPPKPKP